MAEGEGKEKGRCLNEKEVIRCTGVRTVEVCVATTREVGGRKVLENSWIASMVKIADDDLQTQTELEFLFRTFSTGSIGYHQHPITPWAFVLSGFIFAAIFILKSLFHSIAQY